MFVLVAIFCNFQNGLIFEYQVFFRAVFCLEQLQCVILVVLILSQSDDFGKAIAFAWWPFLTIFKMVSFFKV